MLKYSASINSVRGAEREFKTLLIGDETALDNFRLYFVRQKGEVDIPRYKHNFDQISHGLEGGRQNFGAGKWIAPGEIAYFPRARPMGPNRATPNGSASRCSVAARAAVALSARPACNAPWMK